jgi:threonine aldolase
MKLIDFRSDTVTKPTPAMREAMANAEVGDDVYGEDPTVNKLEELAAEVMGKEAGLFVASGTMGNLVAVVAHCQRGDEIVLGDQSHIFKYEVAGATVVGGVAYHIIPNDRYGKLNPADVQNAIRGENVHYPKTGLVCLENSHNVAGGTVLSVAEMKELADISHKQSIPVHLDGARVFNAATALEVKISELVADIDSVQFCLSKGLAAPAGSLLVGKRDFIDRARKIRKMLGGGMRQAGVLAAAGLISITEMTQRLYDDHYNARQLAERLALVKGFHLDMDTVQTNIVRVDLDETTHDAATWVAMLKKESVLLNAMGARILRFVTHNDVDRNDVDAAIGIIAKLA